MEQRTKTLRQIFEEEAKRLGVIALYGDEPTDGHSGGDDVPRGGQPTSPKYVMLPGGDERVQHGSVKYVFGLHQLALIAGDKGESNIEALADDLLNGKRSISDTLLAVIGPVAHGLKRVLAREVTKRLDIAPLGAYTDFIGQQHAAWQWVTERVTGRVSAEEQRVFEESRDEAMEAHATEAAESALGYYRLVLRDGKAVTQRRLAEATRRAMNDYTGGNDGCGTCPSCKTDAARRAKAAALIAQITTKGAQGTAQGTGDCGQIARP